MEQINSKVAVRETKSSLSPALVFPDLQVKYPENVIKALIKIYEETNNGFKPLIDLNREWSTDYNYCINNHSPTNWIVQVDMCGLPEELINRLGVMPQNEVEAIIKNRIFEVENSWAVYQLLDRVCQKNDMLSFYGKQTRAMMNSIRKESGMPIALLAVTEEKYLGMKATEFGKNPDEPLSQEEVLELSGFDQFFGPTEFINYLSSNNGECNYLLYVRASDPIEKLKKPETKVAHPLLGDTELRKIIKKNALTFNIDNPEWDNLDKRRINDTKWYMPDMAMAFPIFSLDDLKTTEFANFLSNKGFGIEDLLLDKIVIRAKPAQGTFGCYGHLRGSLANGEFRSNLKKCLRDRGAYMIQIEQEAPTVKHFPTEDEYAFIDRVFLGTIDGKSQWMGGHREFLPCNSQEVKQGRLHGNKQAVYAEIL